MNLALAELITTISRNHETAMVLLHNNDLLIEQLIQAVSPKPVRRRPPRHTAGALEDHLMLQPHDDAAERRAEKQREYGRKWRAKKKAQETATTEASRRRKDRDYRRAKRAEEKAAEQKPNRGLFSPEGLERLRKSTKARWAAKRKLGIKGGKLPTNNQIAGAA